MKRSTGAFVGLLVALSGCTSSQPTGSGQYMSRAFDHGNTGCMSGVALSGPSVPGFQGPYGQPVAVAAPYSASPPGGADLARAMVRQSMPLALVQQTGFVPDGKNGITQAQFCPPGANPPQTLMPPGLPGPMGPAMPGGNPFVPGQGPPGAVAAVGALTGGPSPYPVGRTEIRFTGPNGMRVTWFAPTPDGKAGFGPNYLEAPGRYNFLQAAIYRLKLSNIPNRPGVELYPTLEVVPGNHRTAAFLAHSAVPVTFTEEDFNQVASGNFLVKVIYLPDPQFQDLAATGTDEVISSRLEPGVDPIAEAHRRGSILAVIRMGNIDLEAPNTPAMDAPCTYGPQPNPAPGAPGRPMLPPAPGVPPGAGQPPPPGVSSGAAPAAPSGQAPAASAPVGKPPAPAPFQATQFMPPLPGPASATTGGQSK
jgi:hypothetical protein